MLRSLNRVLAIAFQPSLASGCLDSKVVIQGTSTGYYAWMRTGRSLPVLQLPAPLACGTQDVHFTSLFCVCTAASGLSDKAQQVCKCSAGETCAACRRAAHAIFSAGFTVDPKDSGRHDLACQAAPAMKVGTISRRRTVSRNPARSLDTPVRLLHENGCRSQFCLQSSRHLTLACPGLSLFRQRAPARGSEGRRLRHPPLFIRKYNISWQQEWFLRYRSVAAPGARKHDGHRRQSCGYAAHQRPEAWD